MTQTAIGPTSVANGPSSLSQVIRLDLVARGLGASSCQLYHETWYTPESSV